MMRLIRLIVFVTAILPGLAIAETASQQELESAWLSFMHARGEASLILGDVEHATANEVFRVIPEVDADSLNEAKLRLGTDLFNEARLSRDGTLSCNSCHVALMGGVDRHPVSFGIEGARGTLNAPTIFNAALNFRQFWDGRALTLQEQALGPIEHPNELGHDLDSVVAVLKDIAKYERAFNQIYPDGVTAANLGDAIAYYETMNFTGFSSPFLRQFQQQPLSEQARLGQQRFVEVGCASCHNGINLGGNSYQQLGVAKPWYDIDRPADSADDGLYGRTGREQDRHVFKVPTLHNVAVTGPWLHDGSVTSLYQAVDWMARYELGRYLENRDIDNIVAFLRSLGDSLSMIGDCTVSGGYSISTDCSVGKFATGGLRDEQSEMFDASPTTLPDAAVLTERHEEEYAAALDRVTAAPALIRREIQRIRSGQVAHYDFLQYQHFEMLRHARALSFPPGSLDDIEHEALLSQAAEWQQEAERYELIIADFLRAFAVASSARANYQDLLRLFSAGADEQSLILLAKAEQSMLDYHAKPGPETQSVLEESTQALHGIGLNSERLAELELQVQMLVANVSRAELFFN